MPSFSNMPRPPGSGRPPKLLISHATDGAIAIVIAIFGALLNAGEIYFLARKGKKRNKPEHIILSLSIADFLVSLVFLPFGIATILGGPVLRNKWRLDVCLLFSITTSVLHIFVIAAERLFALLRPFQYRVMVTTRVTRIVIVGMWAVSLGTVGVIAAVSGVDHGTSKIPLFQAYFILVTFFVMITVHGYLAYYLWKRYELKLSANKNVGESHKISNWDRKRDTIFSILIAAAFLVCSLPAVIAWLWKSSPEILFKPMKWMIVLNAVIDPILYFWKSHLKRKGRMPDKPKQAEKSAPMTYNNLHQSATPEISLL